MVFWFVFAFLTALFESAKDVLSKRGLMHVDEYVAAWALRFFATPIVILLLLFIPIPKLGNEFWAALLVSGALNIISTVIYMKALKSSELSLTVPMLAFTPAFLLLTSPIINGEFPSFLGMAGILISVFGSYFMNIRERHKGFLAPFRALIKEPGPRCMFLVAFIWSISSNYDKIGVVNSSSLFWVVALNIFLVIFMTPLMLMRSRGSGKMIKTHLKSLVPIGMVSALGLMAQMTAISMTLVAYVISVKRMSAVLGVVFGYTIFKEKNVRERLIGALIMVIGIIVLAFA
jgi:drug/metabolite transporter (DMT)-like permease